MSARPTLTEYCQALHSCVKFQLAVIGESKFVGQSGNVELIDTPKNLQIGRLIPGVKRPGDKNVYMLMGCCHIVAQSIKSVHDLDNKKAIAQLIDNATTASGVDAGVPEDFDVERISALGIQPATLCPQIPMTILNLASFGISDFGLPDPLTTVREILQLIGREQNNSNYLCTAKLQWLNIRINNIVWKEDPITDGELEKLSSDIYTATQKFVSLLKGLPDTERDALETFEMAMNLCYGLMLMYYNHPNELVDILHLAYDLLRRKRSYLPHRMRMGSPEHKLFLRIAFARSGFVFAEYLSDDPAVFYMSCLEVMEGLAVTLFEIGEGEWLVRLYQESFLQTVVLHRYHSRNIEDTKRKVEKMCATFERLQGFASEARRCDCKGFVDSSNGSKCQSCGGFFHYECAGVNFDGEAICSACRDMDEDMDDDSIASIQDSVMEHVNPDDSMEFWPLSLPADDDSKQMELSPCRTNRASQCISSRVRESKAEQKRIVAILDEFKGNDVTAKAYEKTHLILADYKQSLIPLMDEIAELIDRSEKEHHASVQNEIQSIQRQHVQGSTERRDVEAVSKDFGTWGEMLRKCSNEIQKHINARRTPRMAAGAYLSDGTTLNDFLFKAQNLNDQIQALQRVTRVERAHSRHLGVATAQSLAELEKNLLRLQSQEKEMNNSACVISQDVVEFFEECEGKLFELDGRVRDLLESFCSRMEAWSMSDFAVWMRFVDDGKFSADCEKLLANFNAEAISALVWTGLEMKRSFGEWGRS